MRIKTKGYMQMRWYQHKMQGGNFMISLKKRLPKVAIDATNQAPKRNAQARENES